MSSFSDIELLLLESFMSGAIRTGVFFPLEKRLVFDFVFVGGLQC